MCFNCQNIICKECLNDISKYSSECPICRNDISYYKKSIEKINFLNYLRFKCMDCNKIISYDEAFSHKNICNAENYSKEEIINIKKEVKKEYLLEKISFDEYKKLKNDNSVQIKCK